MSFLCLLQWNESGQSWKVKISYLHERLSAVSSQTHRRYKIFSMGWKTGLKLVLDLKSRTHIYWNSLTRLALKLGGNGIRPVCDPTVAMLALVSSAILNTKGSLTNSFIVSRDSCCNTLLEL